MVLLFNGEWAKIAWLFAENLFVVNLFPSEAVISNYMNTVWTNQYINSQHTFFIIYKNLPLSILMYCKDTCKIFLLKTLDVQS